MLDDAVAVGIADGAGARDRRSSPTASTMRALLRAQRVEDVGQAPELHAGDRAGELAHAQVLARERLGELVAARARVAGDELAALIRVARRAEVQASRRR